MTSLTSKIIILVLYINYSSAPNFYLQLNLEILIYNLHYTLYLVGMKKIVKVPKSSINEVLLTTFHR